LALWLSLQNGAADHCDHGWVYGVADNFVALRSKGNPISASVKFGWIRHPCFRTNSCTRETVAELYRPAL
jgi:hypothetical protein